MANYYHYFLHLNFLTFTGPACFALSLIATAFCLRAWRRNGIACDELLFLPGTKYAEASKGDHQMNHIEMLPLNLRHESPNKQQQLKLKQQQQSNALSSRSPTRSFESIEYGIENTENPKITNDDNINGVDTEIIPLTISKENELEGSKSFNWLWSPCRGRRMRKSSTPHTTPNNSHITEDNEKASKIKGIARFFSSSQETNEYAPSGPIVASAGLDLCMPVLFNFHLFMLASKSSSNSSSPSANDDGSSKNKDDDDDGLSELMSIPPQVLPLIFLSILFVRMVIPIKARTRFWTTIHSVVSSPFYSVAFRDAFLGDVLTSLVRPLQDICFAIFYYVACMYGIFTGKVSLEETGSQLTHNILLHNVVLPTCAVLPLLCRFLQTLRQAYEEQRRWPHLGNAFKYLTASLVISYGMTHSEEVRSPLWICSFVFCALYQAWWDVLIDWELITVTANEDSSGVYIPCLGRVQLRSKRLFKSNRSYWRILILNTMFRFTWMLSFIPAYHLNKSGEIKGTFSRDITSVVGFVVSLIELVRRSAWCILKLELETIKLTDDEYVSGTTYSLPSSRLQYSWFAPNERLDESQPPKNFVTMKRAAYRLLVKKLFILELFVWAGLYIGLGLVVSIL